MDIRSSATKNENYLAYLLIEIILVIVLTTAVTGLAILFVLGKMDVRMNTQRLDYFLTNPLVYGLVCFAVSLVAVAFLLYYRNRKYIVGYSFDDANSCLVVEYRTLWNKSASEVRLPYVTLTVTHFEEKKMLFNQVYEGKRLSTTGQDLRLDFVTNNFIWEEQRKDRIDFLERLEDVIG
ncbi:MAG: hypothetical protein ACK500_08870 [Flavobacteriales bacterium]|jgi:hypothetical protein